MTLSTVKYNFKNRNDKQLGGSSLENKISETDTKPKIVDPIQPKTEKSIKDTETSPDPQKKNKDEKELSGLKETGVHVLEGNYSQCKPKINDEDTDFNQRCINAGINGICKQVLADQIKAGNNIKEKDDFIDFIRNASYQLVDDPGGKQDQRMMIDWLPDACSSLTNDFQVEMREELQKLRNEVKDKDRSWKQCHLDKKKLIEENFQAKIDLEAKLTAHTQEELQQKDELINMYKTQADQLILKLQKGETIPGAQERIQQLEIELAKLKNCKNNNDELVKLQKKVNVNQAALKTCNGNMKIKKQELETLKEENKKLTVSLKE